MNVEDDDGIVELQSDTLFLGGHCGAEVYSIVFHSGSNPLDYV